jgi:cell division protein FtsI/penicillin-binding protein 2
MAENQSTRRLSWLLWGLLLWAGVIFARLVSLQVFEHDDLAKQAQHQQSRTIEISAMRGSILDRTGQPLAKSMPAESVCVNPQTGLGGIPAGDAPLLSTSPTGGARSGNHRRVEH